MRTLGVIFIVTLFFVGVLLALTFAGIPTLFVWMVASVATVVFCSKMIHLYMIGPVPAWGYLLILVVISGYVLKGSPWYVRDAISRSGIVSGMGIADGIRPSNPIKLQQGLFATKERSLRLQEDATALEVDAIYKGMPADGMLTYDQQTVLKKAEEKLFTLRKEREKLKLLSEGKEPDWSTSAKSARIYGAASSGDVITIDHPGTYGARPEGGPITVRVKGCYHMEWDAKDNPMVITHNGLRYVEPVGPEQVDIKGNLKEFRVSNLVGKEGELIIVASSQR